MEGGPEAEPEVTDVQLPFAPWAICRTVDGFLSPAECREIMRHADAKGWHQAMIQVGGGRQVLKEDYRRCQRAYLDDDAMAEQLLE